MLNLRRRLSQIMEIVDELHGDEEDPDSSLPKYEVLRRAQLRVGLEKDSEKCGSLKAGEIVQALQVHTLGTGQVRVQCKPKKGSTKNPGWTSTVNDQGHELLRLVETNPAALEAPQSTLKPSKWGTIMGAFDTLSKLSTAAPPQTDLNRVLNPMADLSIDSVDTMVDSTVANNQDVVIGQLKQQVQHVAEQRGIIWKDVEPSVNKAFEEMTALTPDKVRMELDKIKRDPEKFIMSTSMTVRQLQADPKAS